MMKFRLVATLALCATMFLSCAKQELEGVQDSSGNVSVTLSLDIPTSEIVTRAAGNDQRENGVSHLDVLFFDAAGANSSDPLFTKRYRLDYVSTVEAGKIRAVIKDMPTGIYMVMVVANANVAVYSGIEGKTLSWAQANLVSQVGATMAVANFPMAGVSALPEDIQTENQQLRTITLYRAVARFDLQCNLATATDNSFELVSAEVRNARTAGYIFGQSPLSDKSNVSIPSVATIVDYVRPDISGSNPPHADINGTIEAQLYALENSADDPDAQKDEMTCLIVGGKFNGASEMTYYRINVQNIEGKYVIKRNHRYIVRILSVLGPGYGTKQEAEDGLINNIKVEIESWVDGSSGIAIQGDYMMSVSQSKFEFEKMSDNQTAKFEVRIKNMNPEGFYIEQTPAASAAWVALEPGDPFVKGSDNTYSREYALRIKSNNDDTPSNTRTATFTLRHRDGSISLKVTVEQGSTSRINVRVAKQELDGKASTANEVVFDFANANNNNTATGLNWSVSSESDWITLNSSSPSSGRGEGSFSIDVTANPETFPRVGKLRMTITEEGGNQTYHYIPVKQFAPGMVVDVVTLSPVQMSLKIPDEGYSTPYVIKANTFATIKVEHGDEFPAAWGYSTEQVEGGYLLKITSTAVAPRTDPVEGTRATYRVGYIHFYSTKGVRMRTLMLYQGYVKAMPTLNFYDQTYNTQYSLAPDDMNYNGVTLDGELMSKPIIYELAAHGQRVWLDRNINAIKGYDIENHADHKYKDASGTIFFHPKDPKGGYLTEADKVTGPCPAGFRIPNRNDALKMTTAGKNDLIGRRFIAVDDNLMKPVLFRLGESNSIGSFGVIYDGSVSGNFSYFTFNSSNSFITNSPSAYGASGFIRCVSIR